MEKYKNADEENICKTEKLRDRKTSYDTETKTNSKETRDRMYKKA